jgi:tRNA(Ile)-lysidine synthase
MIKFIGKLPKKCTVAFSGGIDSVVVTDFLINGRRDVTLAFFHHGTKTSDEAETYARKFSEDRSLPLVVGRLSQQRPTGLSQEEHWRNERYTFLETTGNVVVTAHHLDDAVETWLFTSIHGESKLIPYRRGRVIRPFLVTPKSELRAWAERRNLTWVEDASNFDTKYMRNLIRHDIVPHAIRVNPGLRTVVKKKYIETYDLSCRTSSV